MVPFFILTRGPDKTLSFDASSSHDPYTNNIITDQTINNIKQTILLLIKALQNLPHLQLSETSSQAYPLYDKILE